MHELSIVEGILQVSLDTAQQANARAIVAIDLVIGELTGVVDDSVHFYFDFLSQGTLAQGAHLRIRRDVAMGRCATCGYSGPVTLPVLTICPQCTSENWQISGGRDLLVASIDIEPEETMAQTTH